MQNNYVWELGCFRDLINCTECNDVGVTPPDQEEIDCLFRCGKEGVSQCIENYWQTGIWSTECNDISIACGCRGDEGGEDEEMANCANDCPNPMASECYQYYKEKGVWMDGCAEVMVDCGCYDPNGELDCYKKALNYIRKNLSFEPNNACAVLAYVEANFKCSQEVIVRPDTPEYFPELNLPTPNPGSNNNLPVKDGPYDEAKRKPIW